MNYVPFAKQNDRITFLHLKRFSILLIFSAGASYEVITGPPEVDQNDQDLSEALTSLSRPTSPACIPAPCQRARELWG